MALNATGQISLGGATAGQSVNLELGNAATATISLNDANVRALLGIASGAIDLGSARGKSSITATYWLSTVSIVGVGSTDGKQHTNIDVITDSSFNTYTVGLGVDTGSPFPSHWSLYFQKRNSDGIVQWQRGLAISGQAQSPWWDAHPAIAADGSGNVYVSTTYLAADIYNTITKYNTSGVLQWQRSLNVTTTGEYTSGLRCDPSGNVYHTSCVGGQFRIVNYNTSGVLQWQRVITPVNGNFLGTHATTDSSGNVYVTAVVSGTGTQGSYDSFIAKYNTSGVLQWQRFLGNLNPQYNGTMSNRCSADSSGNVYISGQAGNGATIAKYNTSGVLQWVRKLMNPSTSAEPRSLGVYTDSASNAYLLLQGIKASTGQEDYIIAKYNTSGVLQWVRALGGTLSENTGQGHAYGGITVNSQINVIGNFIDPSVFTTISDLYGSYNYYYSRPFVSALPLDGSRTGSWTISNIGTITYAVETNFVDSDAVATSSFVDVASTLAESAGSATDAAASQTDFASTYTFVKTSI